MDPGWEEVERLAQAASAADTQKASEQPCADTIARWRRLFGYSYMTAVHLIQRQREDVVRERITDDYWDLVKDDAEAVGYDREAYEHSLQLKNLFKENSATILTTGDDGVTLLLFPLIGLLDSPEKVKEAAGLGGIPKMLHGENDMGMVRMCLVEKETYKKLEDWLTQRTVLKQ